MSQTNRLDCKACEQAFKISKWDSAEAVARKKNGPPCDTCRPELLKDNEQAAVIYSVVHDQYQTDFGQKVCLPLERIEAAIRMMDGYQIDIDDKQECMMKVLNMSRVVMRCQYEKQETERLKQGANKHGKTG
jgi:hypothetical protein